MYTDSTKRALYRPKICQGNRVPLSSVALTRFTRYSETKTVPENAQDRF